MLTYNDAYLCRFADEAMEARAGEEIDKLDPDSTFTTAWRNDLIETQAYILICEDNQAEPDDLFAAKHKIYTKKFSGQIVRARQAAADDDSDLSSPLVNSIPLERG